jgi:hypothetical protein
MKLSMGGNGRGGGIRGNAGVYGEQAAQGLVFLRHAKESAATARSRLAALVARVTPGTALPLLIMYESAPPAPGEVVDAAKARLEAALALGSLDRTRVAHVKLSPLYGIVGAGLAMDTVLRYSRCSPTPPL